VMSGLDQGWDFGVEFGQNGDTSFEVSFDGLKSIARCPIKILLRVYR
jgi:hypothetical protein